METLIAPVRRRLRYQRQSTGKRVEPTERDVLWFQKLHQHGPLPSHYLLEFSRHLGRNDTRALERLGDLYHESNTPHGGPYLDRPREQWSAISKFERTVHDLSPQAEQCLIDREQAAPMRPLSKELYRHRLMVACITASIELAIGRNPALRFIHQDEILTRSPGKTRAIPCRVAYTNPRTGKSQTLDAPLIPDALFGIEYSIGAQKLYRFYMLEADRNTEPVIRASLRETSYLRKMLQYQEVIGRGGYRSHFGMKSPMLLLTVTTSTRHMRNIMQMTEGVVGRAASSYLFRATSEFGDHLRVPDPCYDLLVGPWQRVGQPSLGLDCASEER